MFQGSLTERLEVPGNRCGALTEEVLPQVFFTPILHLIPYRLMLYLSTGLLRHLSRLLAAERHRVDLFSRLANRTVRAGDWSNVRKKLLGCRT